MEPNAPAGSDAVVGGGGARMRRAHRALVFGGVVATTAGVVLLAAGSAHAMTAVACCAALLGADVLLGVGRRRAWRVARSAREADPLVRRRRIGGRVLARIAVLLGLVALLAAAIAVGSERLALGTMVVYLALVLFGGPAWLATIGEEEGGVPG